MKFRSLSLLLLSLATFGSAEMHPFEDVLKFSRQQVVKKPNDAKTRFSLARVLSAGYADSPTDIDVAMNEASGLVVFPASQSVMVKHSDGALTDTEKSYLKEAITNYNRATRFDSASALYGLGYAWMFEQLARRYREILGSSSFGAFENEADVWGKVAAELRRVSYLSKDRDLKSPGRSGPDAYVSRSAAESLLRLRKDKKVRVTDAEAKRLQTQISRVIKIAGA